MSHRMLSSVMTLSLNNADYGHSMTISQQSAKSMSAECLCRAYVCCTTVLQSRVAQYTEEARAAADYFQNAAGLMVSHLKTALIEVGIRGGARPIAAVGAFVKVPHARWLYMHATMQVLRLRYERVDLRATCKPFRV